MCTPATAIELPTGDSFYRRWQVRLAAGPTAADLRLSLVRGFDEFILHVRGSLGSATVDFDRNTYTLKQHRPLDEDLDRYAVVCNEASRLRAQARHTLGTYVLSKFHIGQGGNPFGTSIARLLDAFYARTSTYERIDGSTGAELCVSANKLAGLQKSKVPENNPGRQSCGRTLLSSLVY